MYKYEVDATRTVGATEQTRDTGRTDGQTDGWTDGVKQIYPQQFRCAEDIIMKIEGKEKALKTRD